MAHQDGQDQSAAASPALPAGPAPPAPALFAPASRPPSSDPITAGLRKLWADAENEPVPDHFLTLLDRIDAANLAAKGDAS